MGFIALYLPHIGNSESIIEGGTKFSSSKSHAPTEIKTDGIVGKIEKRREKQKQRSKKWRDIKRVYQSELETKIKELEKENAKLRNLIDMYKSYGAEKLLPNSSQVSDEDGLPKKTQTMLSFLSIKDYYRDKHRIPTIPTGDATIRDSKNNDDRCDKEETKGVETNQNKSHNEELHQVVDKQISILDKNLFEVIKNLL